MSAKTTSVETSATTCGRRNDALEVILIVDAGPYPAGKAGAREQPAAARRNEAVGEPLHICFGPDNSLRYTPTRFVAHPASCCAGAVHQTNRQGGAAHDIPA